MKIAVTCEKGLIFQHFGRTKEINIYDVEGKEVISVQRIDTDGQGHHALVDLLAENKVDTPICGGIDGGAKVALEETGIKLYRGVQGSVDDAVLVLLSGTIGHNPEVHCEHHDNEHGEREHNCGNTGCEKHSC